MLIKSVFAGFGGQGVLSMGLNLAQAGMMEGKYVTYLPSYGAEMRGGTANCTVAVSDEEIASPVASSPDFIVVMNQPSLLKFQNQVDSGGTLFINSSLVEADITRGDIEIIRVAANEIADKMGSPRSANMIMLGAFCKKANLVNIETMIDGLKVTLGSKKALLESNKKALLTGYEL
jgi:2-oxoglutarate ferredoxin oxidoreductase subunit gamma